MVDTALTEDGADPALHSRYFILVCIGRFRRRTASRCDESNQREDGETTAARNEIAFHCALLLNYRTTFLTEIHSFGQWSLVTVGSLSPKRSPKSRSCVEFENEGATHARIRSSCARRILEQFANASLNCA
jgi:hypothetical protein